MGLFGSGKKKDEPMVMVPLAEMEGLKTELKVKQIEEAATQIESNVNALNYYIGQLAVLVDLEREIANVLFSCAASAIAGRRTHLVSEGMLSDVEYQLPILRRYWTSVYPAPSNKGWMIDLVPTGQSLRGVFVPCRGTTE